MEKIFITPQNFEDVIVIIEEKFVAFKFVSDQREDGCFYDFKLENWDPHYKRHMMDKQWFTQEMADFITSNIQP